MTRIVPGPRPETVAMPLTSLQRRVITASLLAPAAILAVLFLPGPAFAVALGLVLLGAGWEWSALAGLTTPATRLAYLALLGVSLLLLLLQLFLLPAGRMVVLALASLGWWLLAVGLFRLREIVPASRPDPRVLLAGLVILDTAWLAIGHLHQASPQGPALVLFLLLLIWTADIAAFFTGRRWGRAKLAPVLSPGKTWAGVYGAAGGGGRPRPGPGTLAGAVPPRPARGPGPVPGHRPDLGGGGPLRELPQAPAGPQGFRLSPPGPRWPPRSHRQPPRRGPLLRAWPHLVGGDAVNCVCGCWGVAL